MGRAQRAEDALMTEMVKEGSRKGVTRFGQGGGQAEAPAHVGGRRRGDGRGRAAQPPGRGSRKRLLPGRRAGACPHQVGGGQERRTSDGHAFHHELGFQGGRSTVRTSKGASAGVGRVTRGGERCAHDRSAGRRRSRTAASVVGTGERCHRDAVRSPRRSSWGSPFSSPAAGQRRVRSVGGRGRRSCAWSAVPRATASRARGFEPTSDATVSMAGGGEPITIDIDAAGRVATDGASAGVLGGPDPQEVIVTGTTSRGEPAEFRLTVPAVRR